EAIRSTDDAEKIAEIFLRRIYARFGMPRKLITDRDPRFTSKFWEHLCKRIGIKRSLSSAYHPRTDGQTEQANKTVKQIIRANLDQFRTNWPKVLPMAELAINDTVNATTKFSPFRLLYGQEVRIPIDEIDKEIKVPTADELIRDMMETLRKARENIKR